jgi:hypothetical protein
MASNTINPGDQGNRKASEGSGQAARGRLKLLGNLLLALGKVILSGTTGDPTGKTNEPPQRSAAVRSSSGGFLSTVSRVLTTHPWLLIIPTAATASFLLLTSLLHVEAWPVFLLSELSAVWLGLALGWAWVDVDLKKVEDPSPQSFDDLGFFYSRIATRSLVLFEVTTAERAMKVKGPGVGGAGFEQRGVSPASTELPPKVQPSGIDDARNLVKDFWRISEREGLEQSSKSASGSERKNEEEQR